MESSHNKTNGYLLVLVLVFGAIFFIIVTAFSGFVISQKKVQTIKYNGARALSIAEAGLNYYRWYLAHNPDDITNGTGLPGPYVHTYADPEGSYIGEFSLDISSIERCGDIMSVDITSTGHTYADPDTEKIVYGRYARPTVAEYAYIINSNVWAGSDRTIIGPYHSNGGIRMDGTNNSTVTSGQETWTCTSSYGCGSSQTVDGVFGTGANSSLWTFPSVPIDFTGLTFDLAAMEASALASGRYFGDSGAFGYRVRFNSNDTFTIYPVTSVYSYQAYNSTDGTHTARNVITGEGSGTTYSIPSDCSLIFVEDKVWLEGEVSSKVTIAAAEVGGSGDGPSIILNDDITYSGSEGGLLAIAENNVLVGLEVPDHMELNGIFVAQNGWFGRNRHYTSALSSSYDPYVCRDSLTMNGTIVSNGRVGTKWTGSGCGGYSSGFNNRFNTYDRDLVEDPPPLTPETSDTYQFIEWRQDE